MKKRVSPTRIPDAVIERAKNLWGKALYLDLQQDELGRLAPLEALLHEVCHAQSLGFQLDKRAPSRTGAYFDKLNAIDPMMGLVGEAKALAIELEAINALGIQRELDIRAVMKGTWAGGASGPAFPWFTFLQFVTKMRRRADIDGQVVARYMRKTLDWPA